MREALELARGFTSGGLPSEILNNLTPEGEKAKKRHTEYPEDSATDIEGNLLDTPLPSRGLTPDSAINVLVAQGMPVQEAADLLTLQDMLSDEGSDGYFKTPMPFQDGESPLVSVVGLTVKGDFSIQWSLKPNEQVPHFIAYQTMKRMHEESQKTFLEDYMEPWTDAVPTNPLEWTAKNAEDWAEFQQLALNDDAMPGWIDQDEWDEMAVEVASNMKKWWGVDLGDTNSTVAPGLRLQRSLHVDEELAGVRETISRLEGLEYDSLGPLGDLVGDILSGSSATQHPLLHKSAQKRVNRRETHKMVRELSDLVNKAYEQAGLPLKQRDPEWEVRYARYEKRDALEEKKGGGRYSPLGGIEGQVLLVKPPGYDVWIPVSRARDALKTVNRIIMLRSIEDRLGSIDQRPDA